MRRLSTLLVLVAAASVATTAHADPIITATHSVTPNGNIAWEVVFEANDGQARGALVDLKFSGNIINILAGPANPANIGDATLFEGFFGYSMAEDSWFYSGSGQPWQTAVPSTFAGNNGGGGGIDGMDPGSTEAYFAYGTAPSNPIENALVAQIVIDSSLSPAGTLSIEGVLARSGQDFAVNQVFAVPEPSTLMLAAMGGCVGLVTVVRRRRR